MYIPGNRADSASFALTSWQRHQRIKNNTCHQVSRALCKTGDRKSDRCGKFTTNCFVQKNKGGRGGITQEDPSVQNERDSRKGRKEVKSWNTILKIYQILSAQNKPIISSVFHSLSTSSSTQPERECKSRSTLGHSNPPTKPLQHFNGLHYRHIQHCSLVTIRQSPSKV